MASARTRMQLRTLAVIVGVACTITPVFNLFTTGDPWSIGQGIVDGLLISLTAGGYLLLVHDGVLRPWLRRVNFATSLLISTAVLMTLFLLGRGVGQVLTRADPAAFLVAFQDGHLPVASVFFASAIITIVFVVQMNRMIGPNVLRYFVTGIYHQPRDEKRVFLFIDLRASTRLAAELGGARYFSLLRRVVGDLSEPVLASRGQIYQYAGDEVVITWPEARALENGNALRCYFEITRAIAANARSYEEEFGTVPEFRGGLHGGSVIAGELGDLKQEIVYVGDTLNVAARLEEHAKHGDLGLVVSDDLLARLPRPLPEGLRCESLGTMPVRGRDDTIAVSRVLAAPA